MIVADQFQKLDLTDSEVATGDQGYSVAEMLPLLFDAALHWLEAGLPLERIKIVAYSEPQAREAAALFARHKTEYLRLDPVTSADVDYDVFISYSRTNLAECRALEQALRERRAGIRIRGAHRGAPSWTHLRGALSARGCASPRLVTPNPDSSTAG